MKRLAVGVQTVDRSSQEMTHNQICLSDDFESGNYNGIVFATVLENLSKRMYIKNF